MALKRIVLKLSGEALKGTAPHGIDPEALTGIGMTIREIAELGAEIALVVGGGNFFRGLPATRQGIARTTGDSIGMLATVMNCLALRDTLETSGVACHLRAAFEITGLVHAFDSREGRRLLKPGTVLILAGGTGHPFFTTDTTAALRACELGADALLKATKVDGVYSEDPMRNREAMRYDRLSYAQALSQQLGIMDSTAFSLCRDNAVPIIVFDFFQPGALRAVMLGDLSQATLVGEMAPVSHDI